MEQLVRQMIRERGLEARAAPTTYLECGYQDLNDAVMGKPQAFLAAFERAARRAVDSGIDVLLPGQTIITELLWKAGITRFDDAVVLDPRPAMLRMAEMMVDLRKAGVSASRRGFYWAKPPADLSAALKRFYED
jgi:hypothetical protein